MRKRVMEYVGFRGGVFSVAYNPAGTQLAVGYGHGRVAVWNAQTGEQVYVLEEHAGGAHSVIYNPAGTRLVVVYGDGSVVMWDAQTGKLKRRLRVLGIVSAVAYNSAGTQLAVGYEDGSVAVWNVQAFERIHRLEGGEQVLSVAYNPAGTHLAVGYRDEVKIWDLTDLSRPLTNTQLFFLELLYASRPEKKDPKKDPYMSLEGIARNNPEVTEAELRDILNSFSPRVKQAIIEKYKLIGRRVTIEAAERRREEERRAALETAERQRKQREVEEKRRLQLEAAEKRK